MADKKILSGVFVDGIIYRTDATEAQIEDLENRLTAEEAKRLEEEGVTKGISGKRKKDADGKLSAVPVAAGREVVRPQGIEKDKNGEPKREVTGGGVINTTGDQVQGGLTAEEAKERADALPTPKAEGEKKSWTPKK